QSLALVEQILVGMLAQETDLQFSSCLAASSTLAASPTQGTYL
ncbi:5393_t:CDS:1, partial [Ambispora gerdemannii]